MLPNTVQVEKIHVFETKRCHTSQICAQLCHVAAKPAPGTPNVPDFKVKSK